MIEPNLEALRERFPDANIRNRDEIDADIAAQAKMLRDDFEETYSYADPYAAFFGTLGGAAVASMADPINIMTLAYRCWKSSWGKLCSRSGYCSRPWLWYWICYRGSYFSR